MPLVPRIAAVATAVPAFPLDQEAVVAGVAPLFEPIADFARLRPVFANTGVRRRFAPVPLDWFSEPHGWAERNRHYLTASLDLLETAAGRALDAADTPATDIGAIIVVSTTGIATPSLDARLIDRLGLPRTVQRLPIFGLGCAGGAIGLARAATMAAAMPDKAVLFLVVELCSLWFRHDDPEKGNIVGTALFGDGAAALILRCTADGPAIVAAGEHTWPDSLDVMGWEVADSGLKALFSRDIPSLVTAELGGVAREFLARHGLGLRDIDRFICHPGGPKVIDACETAFDLVPGTLTDARQILRDFGNMSAASVMFVLERALAERRGDGKSWRRALLTAPGPGFSAGFVVLDHA
ncbi:MAG TPA: 3-oxoacyl-[acyl-carrier-protein] synthase III C-terminal domain-containing protein [Stellaceae bacterium]|jgi:alkylresorcinol/alkylpyrone synthase|nr:3-oxoacyl-[acyl-carrier-protein] synthase III C-terminal domain-containing protein [Stellaceae bacterium]